jgi:hypothetical protein
MLHEDHRTDRTGRALVGLLIVFSLLPGCALRGTPQTAELSVQIDSPASGMRVRSEEEMAIQSTATSPTAVSWIELWVDGELVDTAQAPTPLQPRFSAVQHWMARVPGERLIEVRAYDEKGAASSPASIVVRVSGEEVEQMPLTATPQAAALTIPKATPLPTVPLPTVEATALLCDKSSEYVDDLTVPDNTKIAAGAQFEKTWRVRNDGTCPWGAGYGLAFAEGDQMAGPDRTSVPETEPEEEIDISVTLVAPDKPGTYRGDWRLSAPEGEVFGAKLYVQIIVVASTATPEPTATTALTTTAAPTSTVTSILTITATPTIEG